MIPTSTTNALPDEMDELLTEFVAESIDLLQQLPSYLEVYQQNPNDLDPINGVFRAVHSIKGNASCLGMNAINGFSHSLENTLDDLRNRTLTLTTDLQHSLVEGFDLLQDMIERLLECSIHSELQPHESELLDHIAQLADKHRIGVPEEELLVINALGLADEIARAALPQSADWAQRVRSLVQEPENLQNATDVSASDASLHMEPASFVGVNCQCHGHDVSKRVAALLEIFLASGRGEYDNGLGNSFLESIDEFATWAESVGEPSLGSVLRAAGTDFKAIYESPISVNPTLLAIVWDQLCPELFKLTQKTKEDLKEQANEEEIQTESSNNQPTPGAVKSRYIRIKEEHLDKFLGDVSSLFITREQLKDLQSRMESENKQVKELRQITTTLVAQTNSLQKSVVALRAIPIRQLFSKFPQLARRLASNLNKKINVHLSGEDIEADKSLLEDLDAPLIHMVRNAVDHAIETPEERRHRGADECGNLWLKAELSGGQLIVTVKDDGRGIDPARLRNKAVEKGLYTRAQVEALSDQEAIELILHPGFSTSERVTDISGRGVGMDVVSTKLREYNGDLKIESEVGVGSIFRLEIPLRQAVVVIDGLLLEQASKKFVLPFKHIIKIFEFDNRELKTVQRSTVVTMEEQFYAAVSLGEMLDLEATSVTAGEKTVGVLIGCDQGSLCLLVDRIIGRKKVVVNSINEILPQTEMIAGVAQLSGGQLTLVLSVPELVKSFKNTRERSPGGPLRALSHAT